MAEAVCGGTILRVKRKADEDPLEALLVSKRATAEHAVFGAEFLFSCIGTFALSTDLDSAPSRKLIMDRIRARELKKKTPAAAAAVADPAQRRSALSEEQTAGRLQRALTMRGLDVESEGADEGQAFLSVFDVDVQPPRAPRPVRAPPLRTTALTAGAITCNNLPMERLSLKSRDDEQEREAMDAEGLPGAAAAAGEGEGRGEDGGEYVYDLYYAEGRWEEDEVAVRRCVGVDGELVNTSDEEEAAGDDEDSNAEGNWRHDYPDESSHGDPSDPDNWDGEEGSSARSSVDLGWGVGDVDTDGSS